MAAKYEINFPHFDTDSLYNVYKTNADIIPYAEAWLKKFTTDGNSGYVVADMIETSKNKELTDSQRHYLTRIVRNMLPEWAKYNTDLITWYNGRPDIQEMYQHAHNGEGYVYVVHPETSQWISSKDAEWNPDWGKTPANADMFWRSLNDWNVRKFIAVNRDTVFEEGDLVVLRTPFIANWDYDPLFDRSNMPDKAVPRIGTILQMTSEVHRNSRAGKGSRAVNVLWNGTTEPKLVPERTIKLYERRRRTKKKV
jgi:hypothetical protein